MGQLWDLVQAYRDRFNPHPPSVRSVAQLLGMSPTALGNWDAELSRLPDRRNLLALADLTGVPYARVVDAALADAKFLPEQAARAEEQRLEEVERAHWRDVWVYLRDGLRAAGWNYSEIKTVEQRSKASRIFDLGVHSQNPDSNLALNAREVLRGTVKFPRWLVDEIDLELLSEPSTRTDDLIAAHDEDASISGEQLEPDTP